MKSIRHTGIELLRCLMMFGVVFQHQCFFSSLSKLYPYQLSLMRSFGAICVPAFVFISGWYGIKLRTAKVVSFLGLGVYAALVMLLVSCFSGTGVEIKYSLGWFGNCYLVLMLLSPILNGAVDALVSKGTKSLLLAWGGYVLAMLVNWAPDNVLGCDLKVWGWGALSVNTLVFIYVTGRVIRHLFDADFKIVKLSWCSLLLIFAACKVIELILIFLPWYLKARPWAGLLRELGPGYGNPFTLLSAIVLFLMFLKIQFGGIFGKIVLLTAPSMFMVFLLHHGTNGELARFCIGRLEPFFGANWFVSTVSVAFVTFLVCLGVDLIRRVLLKTIKRSVLI